VPGSHARDTTATTRPLEDKYLGTSLTRFDGSTDARTTKADDDDISLVTPAIDVARFDDSVRTLAHGSPRRDQTPVDRLKIGFAV